MKIKTIALLFSVLAVMSISSIGVLGNTQSAYAGFCFSNADCPVSQVCDIPTGACLPDDIPPVITCPPNVTIQLGDSSDTGTANATDNRDPNPGVTFEDESSLDECGVGTITRTWTATDAAGNTGICLQSITIEGECVAGELLPLDNTSLFLAGFSSVAIWMVPTLLGIAGAGIYFIKTRKH